MNKSNTLYWKTATDPAERIEVRLVLNSYIDNDNLYVGLESRSKENPVPHAQEGRASRASRFSAPCCLSC